MSYTLQGAIAALKAVYGDAHATHIAGTFHVHAGTGDPRDAVALADVECNTTDHPGYTVPSVTNNSTNFPDPDPDSGVMTSASLSVGTASGDWDDVPTYVWLTPSTDDTIVLDVFVVDFGEFTDGTPSSGDPVAAQIEKAYPTGA